MTATIIEGGLDTDLEDAVELAPPPPMCDGEDDYEGPCENVAEFKIHTRCCGTVFFLCEECLLALTERLRRLNGVGTGRCVPCKNPIDDLTNHIVFDGRI